jgi:hypothetical protein
MLAGISSVLLPPRRDSEHRGKQTNLSRHKGLRVVAIICANAWVVGRQRRRHQAHQTQGNCGIARHGQLSRAGKIGRFRRARRATFWRPDGGERVAKEVINGAEAGRAWYSEIPLVSASSCRVPQATFFVSNATRKYKRQGRSPGRRWWISHRPHIFVSRILTLAEFS